MALPSEPYKDYTLVTKSGPDSLHVTIEVIKTSDDVWHGKTQGTDEADALALARRMVDRWETNPPLGFYPPGAEPWVGKATGGDFAGPVGVAGLLEFQNATEVAPGTVSAVGADVETRADLALSPHRGHIVHGGRMSMDAPIYLDPYSLATVSGAGELVVAPPTGANAVALTNPSFEAPVVPEGGSTGTITGWTSDVSGDSLIFNPTAIHYDTEGAGDPPIPGAGSQVVQLRGSGSGLGFVYQDTAVAFAAGQVWFLTVAAGWAGTYIYGHNTTAGIYRADTDAALTLRSHDNPEQFRFASLTIVHTVLPGAPEIGALARVKLVGGWESGPVARVHYDNVQLSWDP